MLKSFLLRRGWAQQLKKEPIKKQEKIAPDLSQCYPSSREREKVKSAAVGK